MKKTEKQITGCVVKIIKYWKGLEKQTASESRGFLYYWLLEKGQKIQDSEVPDFLFKLDQSNF